MAFPVILLQRLGIFSRLSSNMSSSYDLMSKTRGRTIYSSTIYESSRFSKIKQVDFVWFG